ncbi:hypothetical protein [Cohnella sp. REN36]|uniref:hypothetical protein n=1 Tax=Cohnella sp. REN36 TaxID=2887347 RepID=UPI001D142828|nr:hypothetical protein [Cohnella sp. REN36]MCC3371558.1 hypothetical protein [Cohnella sp. REN36]
MTYAFAIEPGLYVAFADEEEQLDQCKEWGLLSEKAVKSKTFYYKGNGANETCRIVGYVDKMTAVIAFGNEQKHCIHPAFLKEMQAASFGQRYGAKTDADETADAEASGRDEGNESDLAPVEEREAERLSDAGAEPPAIHAPASKPFDASPEEVEPSPASEPAKAASAKTRVKKIALPEEKVKMVATVQAFATIPNHFADNDDEVVIYEAVTIAEPETDLGTAWSSHSATLKKLELAIGDTISFEAKIVAKKLTKHPVPYKINNPAKIQKTEG